MTAFGGWDATPRDVAKRSSGVTRAGAASRAGGRSTSASSSKSCRGAKRSPVHAQLEETVASFKWVG